MATIDYKQKIKDYMNSSEVDTLYKSMLNNLFPELAESEDERIRKEMITYLSTVEDKELIPYESWIAWLEKQGEQKPTEEYNITGISSNKSQGKLGEIIKNLKTTWSEGDEQMIRNVQNDYHNRLGAGIIPQAYHDKVISWLKSLKDRYTWKPSDEQMIAIQEAMNIVGILTITGSKINSLYQDLKKLRKK